MADLSTILKDPNYVNANAATKQAIFDKWAPQDPNYSGANPATQGAIRVKFGLGDTASTGSTQEGTMGAYVPRRETPKPGMFDFLSAPFEMGQQLAAKPRAEQAAFIAPTVEALGATGGALLGGAVGTAGAGPVGTAVGGVAGAGAGYAGAKGLMRLIGGTNVEEPVSRTAQRVVSDVAEGGTYEAGGRAVGPALGWAASKVADLRQMPIQKAAKIAKATLGEDLPVVLNNLRNASPDASVNELTASIQNPAWQTLLANAQKRDPETVKAIYRLALTDEAAATNALAKLAGGSTATETRSTVEQAKKALNSMTGPQRESALSRANLGKSVAEYEAQAGKLSGEAAAEVQKVRDLISAGNSAEAWARLDLIKRNLPVGATKYTHFGELSNKALNEWSDAAAQGSLDLGQGARFAQGAADALRSVGIKPLEGEKLVQSVSALANKPEFAGNDVLAGAVKNVADDIAKWTSNGGVIDAHALEAIRKNSVNAAIAKLRPGADATSQRNLAAGVMSKIKPMIDDAIEGAGGDGWRDYLTAHTKGMQQIAEKKLTGEALNLWKTDKDAFVKLVQGESPDTVEKILGSGKYDIANEVADNTLSVLQDQARKHLTKMSVKSQAGEGGAALATIMEQQVSRLKLPSLLNFWSTVGNRTLDELERKIGQNTMTALTEASKTPGGVVKLLETMPAAERIRIIGLVSNPAQWKAGSAAAAGVAAKNILVPDTTKKNSLAP